MEHNRDIKSNRIRMKRNKHNIWINETYEMTTKPRPENINLLISMCMCAYN